MLNIKPEDYKYCPFCSIKLSNKLEEGKKRKFCNSCDWTYYPHVKTSVSGIIIKDNKTLLVRRNRQPYKGTWSAPAGFIDYGEHPEEALVREVKEETNLDVKEYTYFDVLQSRDDPRAMGHFVFLYLVTKFSGKVKINDRKESSNIDWFFFDKLPHIKWKCHKEVLGKLKKGEYY